ncbi:hypothetical protein ACJX0J_030126, partial [Zea mays]
RILWKNIRYIMHAVGGYACHPAGIAFPAFSAITHYLLSHEWTKFLHGWMNSLAFYIEDNVITNGHRNIVVLLALTFFLFTKFFFVFIAQLIGYDFLYMLITFIFVNILIALTFSFLGFIKCYEVIIEILLCMNMWNWCYPNYSFQNIIQTLLETKKTWGTNTLGGSIWTPRKYAIFLSSLCLLMFTITHIQFKLVKDTWTHMYIINSGTKKDMLFYFKI